MSGQPEAEGNSTRSPSLFRLMEYVVLLATFATTMSGVVRWLGSDSFPRAMWTVLPILGAFNAALIALSCLVLLILGARSKEASLLPLALLALLTLISAVVASWIFQLDEATVLSLGPV